MPEITLSNEELEVLSDCILSAMQSVNQAQRLILPANLTERYKNMKQGYLN
jgi:hypothetical protein